LSTSSQVASRIEIPLEASMASLPHPNRWIDCGPRLSG